MRPLLFLALLPGCTLVPVAVETPPPALAGQDVRLTLLHISDVHSRILPYEFDPSFTDNGLGLMDDMGPYGGIARIATILDQERARSGRVMVVDTGDMFQGAIIFNEFGGEAEMRTLSEAGVDVTVVGNHEFDAGAQNLADMYRPYGAFPLLAANYDFEESSAPWATDLEDLVDTSAVFDLDGLRVGYIGLGNLSSLSSVYDESNSMGITAMAAGQVVPEEAAKLRALGADLVVVLSHLGLDDDIELARNLPDIDIVLGGHHHVAIDPPLVVTNKVSGKRIPVVHSGAFSKYVGRVELIVRDGQILSTDYELFPIQTYNPHSSLFIEEDPAVVEILEDYEYWLSQDYNMDQVIGYAEDTLTRYGTTGGDSMLGNFAADAMRFYQGVETEIALTNTLGIRADINPGDITLDALYNSMPFDNTITTMFLSGREVQELLDYVAYRSSERGCNAQAQVSGIRFVMDCKAQVATDIVINGAPLDPDGTYELATNNYIANGGSGFEVLERNTTQHDTGISIRDVVLSSIQAYHSLPQPGVAEEEGRILAVY